MKRARQRDPDGLMLGFEQGLSPALHEVGVDRMDISVSGRWSSPRSMTEFFSNRLQIVENRWLNVPVAREGATTVELTQRSSQNTSTISNLSIRVSARAGQIGSIKIKIGLNPTRTLHHLLAYFEQGEGEADGPLLDRLSLLSPLEFFSKSSRATEMAVSLDGGDNFLPDVSLARRLVHVDFWPTYLEVFCEQLRRLCELILSETGAALDEGLSSNERLELDWAEVRVPQIECYFERYHRSAVWAVRQGCWHLLAADHSATVRSYEGDWSAVRDNRRFAASLPLTSGCHLAIYAKLHDRLRFERRRNGRGNYIRLARNRTGMARLLAIIQMERQSLIDGVRWGEIGEIFSGPDEAAVPDFLLLIEQVEAASRGNAATFGHLLKSLIIEGAVVRPRAGPTLDLGGPIRELQERGVIDRARIRPRDLNGRDTRYALRSPFREIHSLFVEPLRREFNAD